MMNHKSKDDFAALVGIDWADKKHDICLQPAGSDKQEFSVLPHKPEAIDEWARGLRTRFGNKQVAVCLEQKKGPLIYALRKYDFLVLFPVNPQTLAKYRRTFTTSRAKDDPFLTPSPSDLDSTIIKGHLLQMTYRLEILDH